MSCLQQGWEHHKVVCNCNLSKPWNNVCPHAGTSISQDLHFSSASHFWKLWAACASVWCFMACFRKTLSKSDGLKIKDSAAAPSALLEAWQWGKKVRVVRQDFCTFESLILRQKIQCDGAPDAQTGHQYPSTVWTQESHVVGILALSCSEQLIR